MRAQWHHYAGCQHPDWLEVGWPPAHAPELNPVEMAWNHTKYGDLANLLPEDMGHLRQSVVTASIEGTHRKTQLIRSFFQHTGLDL
jgi:hypothetical protein